MNDSDFMDKRDEPTGRSGPLCKMTKRIQNRRGKELQRGRSDALEWKEEAEH